MSMSSLTSSDDGESDFRVDAPTIVGGVAGVKLAGGADQAAADAGMKPGVRDVVAGKADAAGADGEAARVGVGAALPGAIDDGADNANEGG
ncbi:hypothetical protein HK104_000033 [Borealophlyctis nickersoniae]|nr:hypothetical protein HK104_000033 [Borealophlyctis nickersoniae]